MMNRIFKVVWSRAKNCWVVASELAKRKTKLSVSKSFSRKLVVNVLICLLSLNVYTSVYAEPAPTYISTADLANNYENIYNLGNFGSNDGPNGETYHYINAFAATNKTTGNVELFVGLNGLFSTGGSNDIGSAIAYKKGIKMYNTYNEAVNFAKQGYFTIPTAMTYLTDNYFYKVGGISGNGSGNDGGSTPYVGINSIDGTNQTGEGASGTDAIAIGRNASASSDYGVSVGLGAKASGSGAVAIGGKIFNADDESIDTEYSVASGTRSVAIGVGSHATHADSVALGSYSTTTESNVISVGTSGLTRKIVNVADGTANTDASTVGQTGSDLEISGTTLSLKNANGTVLDSVILPRSVVYTDANHNNVVLDGSGGTKLSGLKEANLSATSTEAVSGSQLYATNQRVAIVEGDINTINNNISHLKDMEGKVTNTLATTQKYYVTGTTSATTNTGGQVFDTGVYVTEKAGQLHTGSLDTGAITATGLTLSGSAPALYSKDTGATRGTAPASKRTRWGLQLQDSAGKVQGGVYKSIGTDNVTLTALYDFPNHNNTTGGKYIGIGHDGSGNVYTYAPTPGADSNDTNIATTAFVRREVRPTADGTFVKKANTTAANLTALDTAGKNAIKGMSVSGTTLTYTKGDGTSGTVALPTAGPTGAVTSYNFATFRNTHSNINRIEHDFAYTGEDTDFSRYVYIGQNNSSGAIEIWQYDGSYLFGEPEIKGNTVGNVYTMAGGKGNGGIADGNSVTGLFAGTGTAANAPTTNGNTKLSVADDANVRNSITIEGSGATTVTSDANGVITIHTTDNDTKYSTGTASALGLTKLYTATGTNTDGAMTQKATTDALNTKLNLTGGTLTGGLTISTATPSLTLTSTALDLDSKPASNTAKNLVAMKDKDGENLVLFNKYMQKDGGTFTRIIDYNKFPGEEEGTTVTKSAEIRVGVNKDGVAYATAPTPDITSNGTNIATTAFVRSLTQPTANGTFIRKANTSADNLVALDTAAKNAIKGLSVSGSTLTYTKGDNTTGSVTLPSAGENVADGNSVTHLYAGTGTAANAPTTNGYTKLSVADDANVRNSITIKGTGATTVTSDANGVITVNSTDTQYNAATQSVAGLMSAADKKKLDLINFGNKDNGEHDANNIKTNGLYYYSSNGPTTAQGASTADGGLYAQFYNTSWGGQIAQDYRNGNLFVRGLNNGNWTDWHAVLTDASDLNAAKLKGLTKKQVTDALGYTPPTADTNTHYKTTMYAGTGTKANAETTNGYTKIALFDDSTARSTLTLQGTGGTTVTSDKNGVITINSVDNDTTYSAGTADLLSAGTDTANRVWSAKVLSGYVKGQSDDKIKGLSVSGTTITYTKGDGTTGTITTQDKDTHYTTHLYAGSGTAANAATTNGSTKLTVADNSTVRNSVTLKGAGGTTVTSDANGVVTISTDLTDIIDSIPDAANYTAGNGLTLSGNVFSAKAGTNVTVNSKGINVIASGNVASGNTGLISGGKLYDEARLTADGTFAKKANTVAANLAALDTAVNTVSAGSKPSEGGTFTDPDKPVGQNLDALDEGLKQAIKGLSASGKVITYTRGDNSTGTITTQDKEVKTNKANTTKLFLTGATGATTGELSYDDGIYATTTAGQLHVGSLQSGGAISGTTGAFTGQLTAATAAPGTNSTVVATTAFVNNAIGTAIDGLGDELKPPEGGTFTNPEKPVGQNLDALDKGLKLAIKGLSANGKVITYTRGDNSTGTITTQDKEVKTNKANTTKLFLAGATGATTGELSYDDGIYTTTKAGELHVGSLQSGGAISGTTAAFTGEITAATAAAGTNSTVVATTAFVKNAIDSAVGGIDGGSKPSPGGTFVKPEKTTGQNLDALDAGLKQAIKGLSANGKVITYTRGDDSTGTITTQDKEVKTNKANTTKLFLTGATGATTGELSYDDGIYATTTAGQLHVGSLQSGGAISGTTISGTTVNGTNGAFTGQLTAPTAEAGTNSTVVATTAFVKNAIDTAVGGIDGGSKPSPGGTFVKPENTTGQNFDALDAGLKQAIKGLSVNGKVVTYTRGDNSTGTITTQDKEVKTNKANTTKLFLTGATGATTGELSYDDGIYATTKAGELHVGSLQSGGAITGTTISGTTGAFTGQVTAATAAPGTNSTVVATTAFVKNAVDTAVGSIGANSKPSAGGTFVDPNKTTGENFDALDAGLTKEIQDRIAGDQALSDRIGVITADKNYIKKSATKNVSENLILLDAQVKTNATGLATEITNRTNADTALSNRIGTLSEDKNYIRKAKNVSENLTLLDAQAKSTADALQHMNDDILQKIGSIDEDGHFIKKDESVFDNLSHLDDQVNKNKTDLAAEIVNRTNADDDLSKRIGVITEDGNYIKKSSSKNLSENLVLLDNQVKTNATGLAKEIIDRTQAVANEATLRTNADTALSNRIGTLSGNKNYIKTANNVYQNMTLLDSQVKTNETAIATETTNRINADTALSNRIGTLSSNKNYIKTANNVYENMTLLDSQVKTNETAIATETTNRINADNALSNRIGTIAQDGTFIKKSATNNVSQNLVALDTSLKHVRDTSLVGITPDVDNNRFLVYHGNGSYDEIDMEQFGRHYYAGNGLTLTGNVFSVRPGTNVQVNSTGVHVPGNGQIASGNTGLISGGTLYNEVKIPNKAEINEAFGYPSDYTDDHVAYDGMFINRSYTTGQNIWLLDDALHQEYESRVSSFNAMNTRLGMVDAEGNYIKDTATHSFADNLKVLDSALKSLNDDVAALQGSDGGTLNTRVTTLEDSVNTLELTKANINMDNLSSYGKQEIKDLIAEYMAETGNTSNSTSGSPKLMSASPKSLMASAPMSSSSASATTSTGAVASGDEAVAVGSSTASGYMSTAVGIGNVVSGNNSGAFGDPNIVNGNASYAFGNDNTIDGEKTFVLGNDVQATGSNSIVLGDGSDGSLDNVVSVGKEGGERKIVHVADGSVTEDSKDAVNGGQLYKVQQAEGVNTEKWQELLGVGKVESGDTGLVTGNTVYDALQKVSTDRMAGSGTDSVAIGHGSDASGDESVAIGHNNVASGIQALAVGTGNHVTGNHSGAFGDPNTVSGSGSYAVGNDNDVSGDVTFVMGNQVEATGKNSVVLGHGSDGSEDNVVSVGAVGNERRIIHVANGGVYNGSTDAVNGGQLYNMHGELKSDINKVGANAAALASLATPAFENDEKWAFSAGVGNYRSQTAGAVGIFYHPTENVTMNVRGSFGTGDDMVGGGLTVTMNRKGASGLSKAKLVRQVSTQAVQIQQMAAAMNAMQQKLNALTVDPTMASGFRDIPQGHWAGDAAAVLHGNGIMNGYPDGTFRGDRPMTRYEYAEALYNALMRGNMVDNAQVRAYQNELRQIQQQRMAAGQPVVNQSRLVG